MILDSCCNRVFFSAKLPEACPVTYRETAAALDRYGVPHSLLKGTKDIWCRDYMPVQILPNHFVAFGYQPDYLLDSRVHRESISDGLEVARLNGLGGVSDSRGVLVDGGNTVHCGGKVIMTSKVFEENPGLRAVELSHLLEDSFGAKLIVLPWDPDEIYGHTDGILRVIDEDTVLMTNYSQLDPRMAARYRKCLKPHFKRILELHYDVERLNPLSWAYINWLQTDRVLILPRFGIPEDAQAFSQIERAMPQYRGRIESVDARDLVRYEGCLNCASWTVREEPDHSFPTV